MKSNALKQFVTLRNSLVSEKQTIESRLHQINEALGISGGEIPTPAPSQQKLSGKRTMSPAARAKIAAAQRSRWAEQRGSKPSSPSTNGTSSKGTRGRAGNKISLRAAALQLTRAKPLSKQEIIEGAKKLGWSTNSVRPINLLNSILYGKKTPFANKGGKFSS